MPGDDMPPEPIAAMLAQLADETAHMTPEYLEAGLAEVKARYAALSPEERIRIERRAEIAALTAEANRLLAIEEHGPLTEREQDRLDEWRMDEEGRDV